MCDENVWQGELGAIPIEVCAITDVRANREEACDWLSGVAHISWRLAGHMSEEHAEWRVGCWADGTTNDHAEWCAANEGARIIEAVLGLPDEGDTRGSAVRSAWPELCDEIGRAICAALLAEHEATA